MIMPSLTGKTALVTGASRGIGRASALALAAAGAQVLVHYGRGAKEADGVVAEIRKAGGRADAIAADLAAADGAGKLARQARSIVGDRLDILVTNAGILKAATIEETTVEDFDRLFAVNVRAPFFLVQQLLPIMCKGSSIVFLSSLAARAVVGTEPAYSPSGGSVGIAFSIPASTVKTVIAQLKDKGSVSRGWIGVQIQPVTSDIADSLGLKKAEGALVAEPQANGPAAKAGIESGDVITAVNGETVKDARELARTIGALAPGNAVKLNVLHKGQDKVINLTLGQLPNTLEAKADNTNGDKRGAPRGP